MKFFNNKNFLILIILIIIIVIIAIYFFTKDNNSNVTFCSNDLLFDNTINSTSVETPETIAIHIIGEIKTPGIIYLNSDSRIADAIDKAGGITEFADLSKVNLAYELKDGQKIYIPSIYDDTDISFISSDAGSNVLENSNDTNNGTVNINSATQNELESLPGIGASTAKKIIEYREKNGKFKNIEDIMNVSGIGENKFNNIKDYISI